MISVPPLAASAHPEDQLKALLAYAVLAPSSHNSQPWRFVVNGATISVCADRMRALPVVDPFD
ncbi:nitroreductase family protein, partial [Burkholderia sp. SIMBA_045]